MPDDITAILTIKGFPGGDQTVELKAGIYGGILADGSGAPMGAYTGDMDLLKGSMIMGNAMRAYLKLLVEEQGMPIDKAKEYLQFTLNRAVEMEKRNQDKDNVELQDHVLKMRVERNKRND